VIPGAPYRNRTGVSALRGPRPRPLDEGSVRLGNTLTGMRVQAWRRFGTWGFVGTPGIHNRAPSALAWERVGGAIAGERSVTSDMDSGLRPLAGSGLTDCGYVVRNDGGRESATR
jgi:hypothetical protein